MSFSVNKYNRGSQFDFKLPENAEYLKLSELKTGEDYRIHGLFISTKGNFGDHPVAVGDIFYIDLPQNTLEDVRNMINDPEAVDAINNGLVGIVPEPYYSKKFKKDCVGVRWIDMTPEDIDTPTEKQ